MLVICENKNVTMNDQRLKTVLFVLWTFASGQGSFLQNETDLVDDMVRSVMGCKNIPGRYYIEGKRW